MPYTGINDDKLPEHVQELSEDKRRQWIAVFEDVLEKSGDEGEAMAAANAIAKAGKSAVAVKALGDTGRIGGYLVVWGDENRRDLQGEYFTPDTDLGLDWYPRRPVLYHHGMDGTLKGAMIGQLDTLKADDTGLWVEGQLNMREKWAQAVMKLVKRGVIGWSSGSLPHLVEVSRDGQIKTWPIVEGSLTPTPAEPRDTGVSAQKHYSETEAAVAAYKSAGIDDVSHLLEQDAATESTPERELGDEVGQDGDDIRSSSKSTGDNTMSDELNAVQNGMTPEEVEKMFINLRQQEKEEQEQAELRAKAEEADKLREELDALKAQRQPEEPRRRLPGSTTEPKLPDQETPDSDFPRITVGSKFDNLEPVDLAFGLTVMKAYNEKNQSSGQVSEQYANALAAKTWKAGIRPYNAAEQRYYKADELAYSTLSSYGDEWVPDMWNNELWRKARQDNVVLPLFQSVEMPSNPFEMPIEGTDPSVYYVPETKNEANLTLDNANNPIPDSQVGSDKVTLSAKKLGLRVGFSAELLEDSIIPVLPIYREQSMRTMADAIDNVLVNGDTTTAASSNINLNDGTPASTAKYLAFNGLRHLPLVTNTANAQDASGAPTLALMRTTRGLMPGRYALRNRELAWLVDDTTYMKMLSIDEIETVDKYGPNATVLTGEIGKIDGIPVLATAEMSLTMADGMIDSSGNTKGQGVLVYRPGWLVGYRRRVSVTAERIGWADSYQLYSTVRLAFINYDTEVAACLYDITV